MNKKTLVFGASLRAERYSNLAMHELSKHGHETVAFGLKNGEVKGIDIDTKLKAYQDIDTVTLYMNPRRQKEFYDYIISLNPKRVIFNPGTHNSEFERLLNQNDIKSEEACTLVLLSIDQY